MTKTEENIKQVESLRREIAPHLKFLKKQVEKIEKIIEMREQLKNFYLEYFKREDEYIKKEKAKLVEEKSIPLAELTRLEQELKQAKDILSQSKTRDIKSDEIVLLEGKLRETRLTKDSLMREMGRMEGEISYLDRQYKKQLQTASLADVKKVDLSAVESLIQTVSVSLDEGGKSEDLSVIKNILNKIKNLLQDFVNKNKDNSNETSQKEIEQEIKKSMGPIATPKKIYLVHELPKTRSGKIMRRILKSLLIKEEPEGLMTLVNPSSVEKIKDTITENP